MAVNNMDIEKNENILEDKKVDNENENIQEETENKKERTSLIRFPLAKIKNIIKLDNDIKLCQKDVYTVIGKVTEMFLQELSQGAYAVCKSCKRKTINLEDINSAIKMDSIIGFINFGNVFGVFFRIVFWYFATYMLVARLCKKSIREEVKDHRHGEPILAITVTAMLSLMYLVFSGIQIYGLFLGRLQLPEGYTYATYAREGFFPLLAVSIFNLVIVLFCMAFFRESKLLKAVLTVMSLCTFIMIASSAMRMILYVSTYDLTFLRILVLWALMVLFLLFLGVVIQIFKKDFPLFRFGMIVVTICYIGLAFSHPDYIVAKYNLEYSVKQPVDEKYLSELSADAAPVILPYLKAKGYDVSLILEDSVEKHENGERNWKMEEYWMTKRSAKGDSGSWWHRYLRMLQQEYGQQGIRSFNLSRYFALKEAAK